MVENYFSITLNEARTLSWWYSRRNKIDMDPPYQRRGHLWSTTDKAYLIDTILNGYDVPKFYIANFTLGNSPLNKKKLPYAIIDGKQRFEALFDFIDGKIVLNRDFVYFDKPNLKLGGLSYADLQNGYPEIAEIFDQYNLSVMSVSSSSEEPISELFVRLNRSKALTGAELRNAMAGPAPSVIRLIAKHEVFGTNIKFSITRAQDKNAAAKILLFEYHGVMRETKKKNLDEFVKMAQTGKRDLVELPARRVIDTLNDMASIFLPKDELLRSAGIFPVYYWLIRGIPNKYYPLFREFLVRFEEDRRANRKLRDIDPNSTKIDHTLLKYDIFNRSTDDLQSHIERHALLKHKFQLFAVIKITTN